MKYFLAAVSLFSIVEGSFRSMDEHGASFEHAKSHPGYGPAVLVINQVGEDFSVSNEVYVAPGKVLSHSHEKMQAGITWIASPFAGFSMLPKDISLSVGEDYFYINNAKIDMDAVKSSCACKKVKNISFPSTRSEIPAPVRFGVVNLENPAFIQNPDAFLDQAATNPMHIAGKEGYSIMGDDYCILSIDPFPNHPVATLANNIDENETITVLGHSLGTHIYDGTDSMFNNTVSDIWENAKSQGLTKVSVKTKWPIQMTVFSQMAQRKNNKFLVQAVSAKQESGLHATYNKETWDIRRTPPTIEALIVDGLSGSGVYNAHGELVAIVSCALQSFETDHFFNVEDSLKADLRKALSTARNGVSEAEKETAKAGAREIAGILKTAHPVLNIHQVITAEMLTL